jgi:threonine/homoserine/homoserine lactone efflux protein
MFRFIAFILELILNPKAWILKLVVLITFIVLVGSFWNLNYTVMYICMWILSLLILYSLISFIKDSRDVAEMGLKITRIVALTVLVFLCINVENQTVLYIYIWVLWLLLIFSLWSIISGKIKE